MKRKFDQKTQRLEKFRAEAIQIIADYQSKVEEMAQRPRDAGDPLDEKLLESIRDRMREILVSARNAEDKKTLRDLEENASVQETYRAYLCPRREINIEGKLAANLIEWWGIPRTETGALRSLLEKTLEAGEERPEDARSALQKLYKEQDEWAEYRDEYEDSMKSFATGLFVDASAMPILAAICIYYAPAWPPLIVCGFLMAGVAGSCISILNRPPALEGSPSEKIDSYERRIWSRIGVGIAASLIGCGFLGWGLVSIAGPSNTFSELVGLSINSPQSVPAKLIALRIYVPLAVCMLLGFSERAMPSFDRILSHSKNPESADQK
ncbi:MAG: hypothetical protein ACLGSH_17540 [Acidobacteriota bacterium]